MLKYQSQAVAKPYFIGALLIFSLQLLFGLIGATLYVVPTAVPVDLLPFSVVRMIHTNALIDDRRMLPLDRTGELLHAPDDFMLVCSYNPGYQNALKSLKP